MSSLLATETVLPKRISSGIKIKVEDQDAQKIPIEEKRRKNGERKRYPPHTPRIYAAHFRSSQREPTIVLQHEKPDD